MSTGAGASDLLHAEDAGLDAMVRGEQAVAARSPLQLFWRRFRRDKVAITALGFIVVLIFVAIFAGPITKLVGAPEPNTQQTSALDDFGLPDGPSSAHIFGADPIGRDVFSRVLYGAQVSLAVAFLGTGLSVLFGTILGTMAGFYRGWADTIIARSLDVMLAFPVLLFGLGMATACSGQDGCIGGLIQPGLSVVIAIIVLANTP
jgi:peptide/nickel transport system permease protein